MTEKKDLLLNGANGATPDYMQGVGDEDFGGGMDGTGYPRLAFKLARFRLRQGEDEIVLPSNSIEVIILKDYPAISRIYFDSRFDSSGEDDNRPACASADGEHPISTIAEPQNNICATCPQNQKGSRITEDGGKARACGFYKRLVVLIKGHEDVGPVVADVKSMSIFGDSNSGENLWTLKAYFARLKQNGVMPYHLWTELTFDTDESVPKVLFRPMSYVEKPTFVNVVTPMIATPDGKQLLLDMSDTSKVRIEGEDGGGQLALPAGKKPAHLTAPEEEEEDDSETEPSIAEQVAALGTALNDAIAAKDFAAAAEIQGQLDALTGEEEKPAASAKKKATKKKATKKVAAKAKPEPTEEVPTGDSETGFDDELDSALKDFGF